MLNFLKNYVSKYILPVFPRSWISKLHGFRKRFCKILLTKIRFFKLFSNEIYASLDHTVYDV